ncbi:ABC transporter permease [Curvivirga aplysinae]|uniref:ABC transporter permease n=1 Tax=Curvivirga aplysinae TaxID=2529852 RepID=UPI0012BC1B6B|nr:ABC transporter permease [Curvivirga aplysinae]MTI11220.1 multidrug ABC transporter permease [Curvivirga aplysinae]
MSEVATPRRFGRINWIGASYLYVKEVKRFLNVFTQTVAAPVITTLLFLAIFTLALGRAVETVNGVAFASFLAPGLIMMSMAQNAFANTSSSLVISKIQGNIVDVLLPPISPFEFTAAYTLGGVTRGTLVGFVTAIAMSFFVDMSIHNLFFVIFHAVMASMMLSLLGILGGLWSEKFDHIAAVTNFVIMPFSFLSGTFYSITRLPEPFYTLTQFNPFFYMIDGFRYGFIGQSDSVPMIGVAVMLGVNAALFLSAWRWVKSGYKLKA